MFVKVKRCFLEVQVVSMDSVPSNRACYTKEGIWANHSWLAEVLVRVFKFKEIQKGRCFLNDPAYTDTRWSFNYFLKSALSTLNSVHDHSKEVSSLIWDLAVNKQQCHHLRLSSLMFLHLLWWLRVSASGIQGFAGCELTEAALAWLNDCKH